MTPHQKALDLVRNHYSYVNGWTEINRPDQSPAAQYEGAGMKMGRAIISAIITARECREVTGSTDTTETSFWDGVIIHLTEMINEKI